MSNLQRIIPAWQSFTSTTQIAPIRDEAHYHYMADLLESLLEQTGTDESHSLMGLVDLVGNLISAYEQIKHPLPQATGLDALKFLIEQHNIKQSDLPEIGSQGVVSEVLNGKRSLNLRQVKALAKRFAVSPATFI